MNIILEPLLNVAMFLAPVALYFSAALTAFTVEHVRTKYQTKRRYQQIMLNQRCLYRL